MADTRITILIKHEDGKKDTVECRDIADAGEQMISMRSTQAWKKRSVKPVLTASGMPLDDESLPGWTGEESEEDSRNLDSFYRDMGKTVNR